MQPLPVAPIPIWIGGSSEAALKRALRLDGWHGSRLTPAGAPAMVQRLPPSGDDPDYVSQQHRRPVHWVDDHVDLAVVEQVAEGRSARRNHSASPEPFTGGTYSNFRSFAPFGTLWKSSGRSAKVVPQSCRSTCG